MPHTVLLCSLLLAAPPVDADVVLKDGTIHDGSGKPGFKGDVALKGGRIAAVGAFEVKGSPRVLDCTGLIVAPGFIDLHNHGDFPLLAKETRGNVNYLTQGVSTVVTGNCGSGPLNVADYYRRLEGRVGSNVAHLIPHNSLRREVMGEVNRPPTAAEMNRMKAHVEKGMKDGAWGIATGLYYTPGSFADVAELSEVALVVARHGGLYASHVRDEGVGLLPSIDEALTVARRAGLPVHLSHLKAHGRKSWGKAADALAMIEAARKKGEKVTADQYPYTASSTKLAADVIPTAYREGTLKDFLERLDDPEKGPKIRAAIEQNLKNCDGGRSIRIARYKPKSEWQGQNLAALAAREKTSPLDIVLEIERNGGAQIVNFSMSEEDVRLIMKRDYVATASDGQAFTDDGTLIHPRNYGCFPRKIGLFALEEKLIPLEQAIRSATGLPADILRLPERGYLKAGFFADVLVFDPKTFRDTATFEKPHQLSTGVVRLYVNGIVAVEKGKATGAEAGKPLRRR